jgi:transcription elongation factor GreA
MRAVAGCIKNSIERAKEMADKRTQITREGYRELEDELDDLKGRRMNEIAQKLKEAREQGDLSENAEYDAAKDEQRDVKARIDEIEAILKTAVIMDTDDVDSNAVSFGGKVTFLDEMTDEVKEFKIVGSTEANIINGKLSNESPLGLALMKHKIGDEVSVEAPDGVFKYKILDIRK